MKYSLENQFEVGQCVGKKIIRKQQFEVGQCVKDSLENSNLIFDNTYVKDS